MADEEVTVESSPAPYAKKPRKPALSPLQTGLLYGGTAASVAGPLGLLIGVGAGILSKRAHDNYLDIEARDAHNMRSEYQGLKDEISGEMEIADPDEKRMLQSAQRLAADGWYRLQSGDESGRDMIQRANELSRSIIQADITSRKSEEAAQFNTQRGLVGSAAQSYRDQFSTTMSQATELDAQAERVLELTSQKDFDPNKPFNRAVLADMITMGVGGMFKDDPNGFLAGVAEGGAGTIIGGIAKGAKTWIDDEEFKVSREDYNRIALNLRNVTKQYAQQRMSILGQQAQSLNEFGRKVGAIPQDYDLLKYVSGGVDELPLAPERQMPRAAVQPTEQPRATGSWAQSSRPQELQPESLEQDTTRKGPAQWVTDLRAFRDRTLGQQVKRRARPTN